MIDEKQGPSRRVLVKAAAGIGLLVPLHAVSAAALVGTSIFGTASIPVLVPARTMLIAVTRAGSRLVAVGEHGVIIYSDDQAASWHQASVPVDVTLTCVAFATPMLGWAAGQSGVILATSDGGCTWRMQLDGVQVNQLTLKAAQDPAIGTDPSPAASHALKRAGFFLHDGPDKPFLSILVLNPRTVIVFGAYRMAMFTSDGGLNWVDWSLHVYDPFSHNIYDCRFVGPDIYLVGEEGRVFRSTDRGATFLPAGQPSAVTLVGLTAAADGGIIVFGVAGTAYRSSDRGESWVAIDLGTQDNLIAGITLDRSAVILIAGESGAIYLSRDNGNTFMPVPGLPPVSIFGLVHASNGDVIIVGGSGVVSVPARQFSI